MGNYRIVVDYYGRYWVQHKVLWWWCYTHNRDDYWEGSYASSYKTFDKAFEYVSELIKTEQQPTREVTQVWPS